MSADRRYRIYKVEQRGPRGGLRTIGYILREEPTGITLARNIRRGPLKDLRDRLAAKP